MTRITVLKSLISRDAVVVFLARNSSFDGTEEEGSWVLSCDHELSDEKIAELRRELFEQEMRIMLESQFAPLRDVLYTKAFSVVRHD